MQYCEHNYWEDECPICHMPDELAMYIKAIESQLSEAQAEIDRLQKKLAALQDYLDDPLALDVWVYSAYLDETHAWLEKAREILEGDDV